MDTELYSLNLFSLCLTLITYIFNFKITFICSAGFLFFITLSNILSHFEIQINIALVRLILTIITLLCYDKIMIDFELAIFLLTFILLI